MEIRRIIFRETNPARAGGAAYGNDLGKEIRQGLAIRGAGAGGGQRSIGQRAVISQTGVSELAPEHAEDIVGNFALHDRVQQSVQTFQLRRGFAVQMADVKVAAGCGV
jgi:hypothetical protein